MIFSRLRRALASRWAKQVAEVQAITVQAPQLPEPGSLWRPRGDYYFHGESQVPVWIDEDDVALVVHADGLIITMLLNGQRQHSDVWSFQDCFEPVTSREEEDENE